MTSVAALSPVYVIDYARCVMHEARCAREKLPIYRAGDAVVLVGRASTLASVFAPASPRPGEARASGEVVTLLLAESFDDASLFVCRVVEDLRYEVMRVIHWVRE